MATDAEQIKACVYAVHGLLRNLAAIAKKDPDNKSLCDGITRFQAEVLLEFLIRYDKPDGVQHKYDFTTQPA